jgi:hypothetical protein
MYPLPGAEAAAEARLAEFARLVNAALSPILVDRRPGTAAITRR